MKRESEGADEEGENGKVLRVLWGNVRDRLYIDFMIKSEITTG